MTNQTVFAVLCGALAPLGFATAQADRAPPVVQDQWSVIKLGRAPAGFTHSVTRSIVLDGEEHFETRVTSRLVMQRFGQSIEIEQDMTMVETVAGDVVSVAKSDLLSGQRSESSLMVREDGRGELTTRAMGQTRESVVICPEGTLGVWGMQQKAVATGFEPGLVWQAKTLVPDQMRVVTVQTRNVGWEEVALPSGSRKLFRTEVKIVDLGLEQTVWVADTGRTILSKMSLMGIDMEMLDVSRVEALAVVADAGVLPPEVFTQSVIVADEFVALPRRTRSVTLLVSPREPGHEIQLLNLGSRQHVEPAEGDVLRVTRRRLEPAEGKTGMRPLREVPDELRPALEASSLIQSDEPRIIEAARELVGDTENAWLAAQRIEAWVDRHMSEKSMEVAFGSALEAFEEQRGDCSEHAMLLAAMARAVGIPCRVVLGLVYLGGIWGGHAWNEVWIDGVWYPLDGTHGYGSADPMRLAMSRLTFADGEEGGGLAGLVGLLGKIDVDVAAVDRDGSPAAAGFVIVGDLFQSYTWGFACKKPESFEYEVVKPAAELRFGIVKMLGERGAGERIEIEISGFDAPASMDWAVQVERFGRGAKADQCTVSGCEARRLSVGGSEIVLVLDGAALFAVRGTGLQGDAGLELFQQVIDSLDFQSIK